jgi:PAS domain S-box-containing protein
MEMKANAGQMSIGNQPATVQDIRIFVDTIPTLAWSTRPDGSADFFNQRWLEYTGLTLEEALDWGWKKTINPDDLPRMLELFQEAVNFVRSFEVEGRFRRFDGEYRWFLFRGNPFCDESGKVIKWYGTNTDLEDIKRVEQALHDAASERMRLDAIRAGVGMALARKDTLNRILQACADAMVHHLDAAFARIWTISNDELYLQLQASAGMYTHLNGSHSRIPIGHFKIGRIARERKAHLTNDIPNDPHISNKEWARSEALISFAGYPLIVEDRIVGVLGMFSRKVLTQNTLDTLAIIADGIAQGIERKHVEDALVASEHNLRLMFAQQVKAHEKLERAFAEIHALKDQLQKENIALREEVDRVSMFEEIVGASPALKAVLSRTEKVAPTDSTVLITGETGTGKELIARAIHKRSPRAERAFVSVNCAALAPSLIASELFGHEKGAFTGAIQRHIGRFELANGGTIFLDEVCEIPQDIQVALLRVLQEREFERVGGKDPIQVNVRIIAATNRNLETAVTATTFRSDLYYRLNVFPIEVPPLRQRKEDILMLLEYFVHRYAAAMRKSFTKIDKQTLMLFQTYEWPGNIRELQNVIERSVIVSSDDTFRVDEAWLPGANDGAKWESTHRETGIALTDERQIIESALAESRGRVSGPKGAAGRLGVPPSTLDSRIRKLEINKSRFKLS